MSPACDDCGGGVRLDGVNVLVRSGGDYQILGPCCSYKHAAHKQYRPNDPRAAVETVQGARVAADGGKRQ